MDEADRWWDGLSPARKAQIHRWIEPKAGQEPIPHDQMTLDVPNEETPHAAA